jgi:hypothetical protein
VKKRIPIWRKLASGSALSVLFAIAMLCFGLTGARAATLRVEHVKSHLVKAKKAAPGGTEHKATLRKASYKTPTHKRRRRWRRHHVVLPKAPSVERTQQIQAALERGGYYSGDPTGKWDAGTQDSLRRFQSANGLPPTGKLDALSLQKMGLGSDVAGVSAPRAVTPASSSDTASATAPKTPGE